MPITNSGSAASAEVAEVDGRVEPRSRQTALRAPMRIESGMLTRAARNTRVAELRTRSASSSVTGTSFATSELPRSPADDAAEPADVLRMSGLVELRAARAAPRTVPCRRPPCPGSRGRVAGQRLRGGEHDDRDQEAASGPRGPSRMRMSFRSGGTASLPRLSAGHWRPRPCGRGRPAPDRYPQQASLRRSTAALKRPLGGRSARRTCRATTPPSLVAVGVEQVVERPDDVAALVVLDLLRPGR